ncbi:hypothetical protein AB0C96_32365 [Streptomyces sp. NPDC048506]|uniref:hypothetical protein n=1 Tax=Streptomyces sp. NPDC048506 TaxID=3155028 RepID=UPI00341286ED
MSVHTGHGRSVFPELWAAVGSPDRDGFRELMARPSVHREARRLDAHPLVMGPLLVLTILLSPFGLLLFLLLWAVVT